MEAVSMEKKGKFPTRRAPPTSSQRKPAPPLSRRVPTRAATFPSFSPPANHPCRHRFPALVPASIRYVLLSVISSGVGRLFSLMGYCPIPVILALCPLPLTHRYP